MGKINRLEGWQLGDLTRRWPPALKGFFLGLARNGLSANPEDVPISGFIGFLRFYTILRRDAWVFSYLPEDGGTSVCEPLGARIQALGGAIKLGHQGHELSSVRVKDIKWRGNPLRERSPQQRSTSSWQPMPKMRRRFCEASFGAEVERSFFPARAFQCGGAAVV